MLMNHKNSRFTAIPDKTHDTIFLKSPKTVFWGHFGPFFVIFARRQFALKNLLQFHPLIYGPRTPWYVSEKINEPIPRNHTDKSNAGEKEGQTLFHRTLLVMTRDPKRKFTTVELLNIASRSFKNKYFEKIHLTPTELYLQN